MYYYKLNILIVFVTFIFRFDHVNRFIKQTSKTIQQVMIPI